MKKDERKEKGKQGRTRNHTVESRLLDQIGQDPELNYELEEGHISFSHSEDSLISVSSNSPIKEFRTFHFLSPSTSPTKNKEHKEKESPIIKILQSKEKPALDPSKEKPALDPSQKTFSKYGLNNFSLEIDVKLQELSKKQPYQIREEIIGLIQNGEIREISQIFNNKEFKYNELDDEGISINQVLDGYGITGIMFATVFGQKDIVKFFLSKDADIDSKNQYGKTVIDLAQIRFSNTGAREDEEILGILKRHKEQKEQDRKSRIRYSESSEQVSTEEAKVIRTKIYNKNSIVKYEGADSTPTSSPFKPTHLKISDQRKLTKSKSDQYRS